MAWALHFTYQKQTELGNYYFLNGWEGGGRGGGGDIKMQIHKK